MGKMRRGEKAQTEEMGGKCGEGRRPRLQNISTITVMQNK
jgi:hypothetical protein